ncbi:MAG: N-methyl-L-tryptophan oxidase, partial [Akkermansiaceae bacterium]|nr:N-methyl-L-tryptophan oxidase [Akkermansiaceae bacterium]
TGGIYLGPPDGEIVGGSLAAARAHDLPHEILDAPQVAARFPQFRIPDGFTGFFDARAGFVVPERAVAAHAARARAHGATLIEGEAITDWKAGADGVTVTTAGGTHTAEHLVVTAGPWTGGLLRDLGVALQVTRQVQAWFAPREDAGRYALGHFPCWFIETHAPHGHYGFPIVEAGGGVKIGLHDQGKPVDPAELRDGIAPPGEEEIAGLRAVLRDYLPGAAGALLEARTCLYTNSPDHHFVVGRHPRHERVTLAAGFSGHGFKFASVMGEVLADLATTGRTERPVGFLGLERFG